MEVWACHLAGVAPARVLEAGLVEVVLALGLVAGRLEARREKASRSQNAPERCYPSWWLLFDLEI